MSVHFWIVLAAAILFVAGAGLIWRPIRAAWRERRFAQARRGFHWQRERLEAKFVQLGSTNIYGPRWTDCEFDDDVAYARNRSTGELYAYVAVTIEMERLGREHSTGASEAVGNLRAATAVFRFDRDHWETDGRVILNLSPTEAIHLYRRDLEMVGQELAERP